MAILEIGFIPFNSAYLLPIFSIYGVSFYIVSTLVYVLLATFAVVLVEKEVILKDE